LQANWEEVERVQLKTDLSKLAHGEVDSIAISLNGLVMQQDLGLSELKLLNRVIVKPLSAFSANKLTQPSEGTARIVINEDNLTRAFNSESFHEKNCQMSEVEDKRVTILIM